uniref:Uncharacterized protein n=1 Tax=Seriola lalandi dorsalis TaxID=1841481 RepID=A0A3B4YJQ9_SERLL
HLKLLLLLLKGFLAILSDIFLCLIYIQMNCTVRGSHYLLLDEISHNLHQRGHEVRMLLQLGFSYEGRADSYQTSSWSLGEKYIKEYNGWFLEQQTQFLLGRYHTDFRTLGYIYDYVVGNRQACVGYFIMFNSWIYLIPVLILSLLYRRLMSLLGLM